MKELFRGVIENEHTYATRHQSTHERLSLDHSIGRQESVRTGHSPDENETG